MGQGWRGSRRGGHDPGDPLPWTRSEQHRFEDKLDKRLEAIENAVDRLSTRQAWIAGGIALGLVILGVAVRFITVGS